MSDGTDARAIIEVAQEATEPRPIEAGRLYSVVVPQGADARVIDTERWLGQPARKRGLYKPATVESFAEYVDAHRDAHTTIWVHPVEGRMVAVLNDNAADPGFGDHRAQLELIPTEEWKHWLSKDGQRMSQAEFAEHVEDGLVDIVEPDGADLLELAQTFQATTNANFRSAQRLQSGETQFQYHEEVEATAGRSGEIKIPAEFTLQVAPFVGLDPEKLVARLRYRLSGGHLALGYKLDRPQELKRLCVDRIANQLRQQFGSTYRGEPKP